MQRVLREIARRHWPETAPTPRSARGPPRQAHLVGLGRRGARTLCTGRMRHARGWAAHEAKEQAIAGTAVRERARREKASAG
jgi:hypothetical protein